MNKFLSPVISVFVGLLLCLSSGATIWAGESTETTDKPTSSGPLVLPEDDAEPETEKKCLTVCQEWGESCVINPRTGNRKCRRTCKQLGEECI